MLIINVKEGENIDRALKRFKRKVRDTKQVINLRDKKQFIKKSVRKRKQMEKAVYKQILKIKEQ
jgi:small subunit ribosomal protein S21